MALDGQHFLRIRCWAPCRAQTGLREVTLHPSPRHTRRPGRGSNKCKRGNWILELSPQKEVPAYSEVRQETTTLPLPGVLDSRPRTQGCPRPSLRVPETDLLCHGPDPAPKDTCANTEGRSYPHPNFLSELKLSTLTQENGKSIFMEKSPRWITHSPGHRSGGH